MTGRRHRAAPERRQSGPAVVRDGVMAAGEGFDVVEVGEEDSGAGSKACRRQRAFPGWDGVNRIRQQT